MRETPWLVKHGLTKHPIYGSWKSMIARVRKHPRYAHIELYEPWRDPQVFLDWAVANGWEPGLTIERRDNALGYTPDNCVWATMKAQERNRTNNRWVEFRGESRVLADWCELLGLSYVAVKERLRLGWSVERALSTPVRFRGPNAVHPVENNQGVHAK